MADQDSLTPDQLDKVMEFQEVTGCTDVCVCVAALAGAEWQVEEAVHAHLTHASDQPSNDGSPSSPEVRRRTGVGVPEPPPLQHPPTEEPTVPQQRPLQVVGQWWGLLSLPLRGMTALLLRWPLRLCCWSLNSLLAVIYSLLYSTSTPPDPARDVASFIAAYESRYPDVRRPPFLQCSYSHALSLARQHLHFLLVYLHCADHLHTDQFCREVLSDAEVLEFLSSHDILCWGCDVALPEGYKVSQALRENGYPYVALLVLRGARVSVVGRMEGPALLSPPAFLRALSAHHQRATPHVTAARLTRLEREQAVALRQEQDTAYAASLRADREKDKRRQDQQRLQQQETRALQLQQQRLQQYRDDLRACIPEEPPAGTPQVLELVVKLPSGERLERRFLPQHKLSALHALVYTHPQAPDRFEVTTNFPRCVLPCRPPIPPPVPHGDNPNGDNPPSPPEGGEGGEDPTFADLNVASRSVLFVKDLDA